MIENASKWSVRQEWPVLLALAVTAVVIIWAWPHLPDRVPIHWDGQGRVNGYGGRFEALVLLPLVMLGLSLLSMVAQLLTGNQGVFRNLRLGFVVLGLGFTALFAFGWNPARVVTINLGLFFLLLGNVLGKTQPSVWVGFRTHWTRLSRRAWVAGQRRSGYFFCAEGLLLVVSGLTLPTALLLPWVMPWTFLAMTVGGMYWLVYLSYRDYRADPNPEPIRG